MHVELCFNWNKMIRKDVFAPKNTKYLFTGRISCNIAGFKGTGVSPRSSRWRPCASSWTERSVDPAEGQKTDRKTTVRVCGKSLTKLGPIIHADRVHRRSSHWNRLKKRLNFCINVVTNIKLHFKDITFTQESAFFSCEYLNRS